MKNKWIKEFQKSFVLDLAISYYLSLGYSVKSHNGTSAVLGRMNRSLFFFMKEENLFLKISNTGKLTTDSTFTIREI